MAAPTFTAQLGTRQSQYGSIVLGASPSTSPVDGGLKGLPGVVV